jgi:hypothetical protein
MPTKRRKIAPSRINEPTPLWATRLLAGEWPEPDGAAEYALFGWLYLSDLVPGLPDPMSEEGKMLWSDHAHQAS